VLKSKEKVSGRIRWKIQFTSDEPAMVNFKRVRSSELIFVVDIDKTFSNKVIFVNYEEKEFISERYYSNLLL
jgi:hypothetical protein